MTRKTNTMLIGLLGTILLGLATWTLVTLIEVSELEMVMAKNLIKI